MISRLRLCLAVAPLLLVADAFAQAPAAPTPRPSVAAVGDENDNVVLKLPDADIDTILSTLENLTGRTVLRPQQLTTATYNLKIPKATKAEAIVAIETVLALNNIGIAPLGEKFIKIVNLQQVKTEAPEMLTGSAFHLPASGRVASKVFQLEFVRVAEVQPVLATILNPFYGGPVQLQNSNALLITDSISNLQRVELLLQQLDKPMTGGLKPKFFTLNNGAKASDVVNKLRGILGTPVMQAQLGQATTYSADDRTNQIIVITDPRQWDFFAELIEKLDQRSDPNTKTDVLYLKHAKAADVVTVLGRIIQNQTGAIQRQGSASVRPGQSPTQPGQPPVPGAPNQPAQPQTPTTVSASSANNPNPDSTNEFSALMTVVNDDRSNAVVISGTTDDIRLAKALIDKLDIALAQVRIEVVIAEVTLRDNNESGISQLGLKVEGDKLVGFGASGSGFSVSGDGGDFASITRAGGGWDLAGIVSLSTTERKDNTAILSVPSITTSHAKEANVFVGETRPVITGSVVSGVGGGTTNTTTQLQIGINLTVTPLIGSDGSVFLEIKQDVDEVGPNVIIDENPQPIIFKRTTSSFVTVKNEEIVVLGGLQRKSNTKKANRLGPIPIIGDLLGSRQRAESRTELVFFLRPHVLTNTPADNASTFKRVEELPQRDEIKKQIDPSFAPPPKSLLDKILPK